MLGRCRRFPQLVLGLAIASLAFAGAARADSDGISKQSQTTLTVQPITCTFSQGTPTTNTTNLSFDISWVDARGRAYFLAERSHGAPSADNQGGALTGATTGDILYIDINNPYDGDAAYAARQRSVRRRALRRERQFRRHERGRPQ